MIENFLVRNSLHISRELGGVDGDPSLCHNKLSKHQVVEVHKLYDFVDTYGTVDVFLSMSSFYTYCENLHSIVDMPNSVIDLSQTPIFEWYVVRCDSKNGYQKNIFKRKWTLCSKMISTKINSWNIIRGYV